LFVLKMTLPAKNKVLGSTGENKTGAVLRNLTLPSLTGTGVMF
jgi:hypothetical protein